MNIQNLSDFLLVATHEGFAQASRQSGRPKASLSRKVMDLESALGVRLFERGAKTIRLTEEGVALLERASGPFKEIMETIELLRDGKTHARGLLRISVQTLLGQLVMGRIAAQFTMAYPDVKLSITLEDRQVDLVSEGYDLVMRINPEPNSELVGRCIATGQVHIVSTPALKKRFYRAGQKSKNSLPVIVRETQRPASSWRISGTSTYEIPTQTVLQLPLLVMIRDAALTGMGAAKLPHLVVADDLDAGRLVSWGTANEQPTELWVLHTSRRLSSAKVKAFIQFLEAEFVKAKVLSPKNTHSVKSF
jgi:DNA-binding transcriptional LysR family regulator